MSRSTARRRRQDDVEESSLLDHYVLVGGGLLAVLVGIAAVAAPGSVPDIADQFGPALVGAVAVVGAGLAALYRMTAEQDQADPPAVEYRGDVVVPGGEFDALLAETERGSYTNRVKARETALGRLREAAVAVTAQTARIPTEAAEERVAEGSWTDDEAAADFLANASSPSAATDWVRTTVGRKSRFQARTDRVVAELAALAPGVDFDDREEHSGATTAGIGGSDTATADATEGGATEDDANDDPPEAVDTTADTSSGTDRRTGRWTGLAGVALFVVGLGALNSNTDLPPSLVVAGATLFGVAALVYATDTPPVTVSVEREVDPARVEAGDRTTVTVTVTNTGDDLIPDLRVVDGVPPGLRVVDGSPRYATALRPGKSATFAYAVEATRGRHTFDDARVIVRGFGGTVERERSIAAEADDSDASDVEVSADLLADADVPVHPQTARRVGRVLTDEGGSGVEFHSVREYRRGDPLSRIDWNRLAESGEFATLQFREEHAATVAVLVDARQLAYVAPRVDAPAALEWELAAADHVVASLLAAGDSVGLGAVSPEWCWLAPRGGTGQRARARDLLESDPAFDAARPDRPFHGHIEERRLRRELPTDAQVVLVTPLCDDDIVAFARDLHARGFPVTVVSPDVTATRTTGQRLAVVERAMRFSRLRRAGIRIVDWDTDRPLESAVESARRRWSA
jgi:uncharacterized repeat protein (TIGR01451 family)